MITQKQVSDIIEAVLERVEVLNTHNDEAYPDIQTTDRIKLISIIRDIVNEVTT